MYRGQEIVENLEFWYFLWFPVFLWYNDCAERNPDRHGRSALLRRDYTGRPRIEK